jgi:uncharacterized GH25 family protein
MNQFPATRLSGFHLWLWTWFLSLWLAAAEPSRSATNSPASTRMLPPVTPLSLTNVLAADENKDWLADGVWQSPPRGRTNDLAGVRFWIEGLLQLQGKAAAENGKKFREKVLLPVPATKTNWQTVHLLGGTAYDAEPSVKVAEVVWRYADGTFRRSPLQYGIHLRDWWGRAYEAPPVVGDKHSKAVWHGRHDAANRSGKFLRLYLTSLANPDTNRVLKALEFVSANSRATPFFVGVTLDVLPRGERAPDFTDLDDGRPGFTAAQFVTVTDFESGKPISGAEVTADMQEAVGTDHEAHFQHTVKTGTNGLASLPKGAAPLDRMTLRIQSDDHTAAKKTWDAKKDGPIPPNVEMKLKRGLLLGGIVKDPDGQPLPGAKIQLNQIWRNSEDLNKPDRVEFKSQDLATDADGRWQTKRVPSEVLPNLIVAASHPDYLAPYGGVTGDSPGMEAALKALKYEIRMFRGGDVEGVVLGPEDAPISGATVTGGNRYDQNSFRETTTGADGRFVLRNLRPEIQPVTATAPGHGPVSKSVTPSTNTVEVTLKLKPSRKLSGVVLNPEGVPVEGADIHYDPQDWEERQRLNIQWRTRSDAGGQFEWADAPDRELEVTVFKEGYASKSHAKVKPGDEVNIIRLTRVRKILGVVGNEDTGEPVTKFTVQWAIGDEQNFHSWSDSNRKEFTDPEGHFTLDLNDEQHNVIRVEADDFAPRQMVLPPAQNDHVQVVVLLKPSPQPDGVVVNPAGEPQAGVTVALTGGQNHVQLARGKLTSFNAGSGMQVTDAQGRFKLRPTVNPGRVVAASDRGYGELPWAQFQQEPTLVLRPWGRIAGTIFSKGKPIAGRKVLLTVQQPGIFDNFHTDFSAYQATSDELGKFAIEQVPPVQCSVVQLVQTSPNSWLHANPTPIEVRSGETTVVELGNRGATVTGRVQAGNVLANRPGAQIMVTLSTPFPQPPGELKGSAEIIAWQQSDAFKAAIQRHRNYNAVPEADGSFNFDGVEPGEYSLSANADWPKPEGKSWERDQLASASRPLVVPENAAQSAGTVDAGDLELKPSTPPSPPMPAP